MMNVQPTRGRGRSVLVMLLAGALGLVGPLLYLHFAGPTGRFEGQTALVIGGVAIAVGVMIVFFSVGAMPNTSMKAGITLWGMTGIASGVGIIAGSADYNWLLFTSFAVACVCWVLAKRQVKKSREIMRHQQLPHE
jgi:hypothetical protein